MRKKIFDIKEKTSQMFHNEGMHNKNFEIHFKRTFF